MNFDEESQCIVWREKLNVLVRRDKLMSIFKNEREIHLYKRKGILGNQVDFFVKSRVLNTFLSYCAKGKSDR